MSPLLGLLLLLSSADEAAMRPGPGEAAPAFSAAATTGKTVALSDLKGKKTVVLAFFPKAFTAG